MAGKTLIEFDAAVGIDRRIAHRCTVATGGLASFALACMVLFAGPTWLVRPQVAFAQTVPPATPVSLAPGITNTTATTEGVAGAETIAPPLNLSQDLPAWTDRINISTPGMWAGLPTITADSTGMVHVLWGERDPLNKIPADGVALFYARFDGKEWSVPLDILTSPNDEEGVEAPSMIYTPNGFLHAVWGTGGSNSKLMYAHAPACCASNPRSWSKPMMLSLPVGSYTTLATDSQGRLHTAFTSLETGTIEYLRSDDNGLTWNVRKQIAGTIRTGEEYPVYPSMAVDRQGRVHVAWSVLPWPGFFALYARSDDGGENWTEPQVIDRGDSRQFIASNYGPIYASVYATTNPAGVDRVHLIWDGPPSVDRNYIYSDDGGKTWSNRFMIFPEITLVGRAGFNPLLMDSAGVLYAFAFDRYSIWLGSGWLAPTPEYQRGFSVGHSAEELAATISLGNNINIVYQEKSEDQPATLWFARGTTSAPQIPPKPLPDIPKDMLSPQPLPADTTSDTLSLRPTPERVLPELNPDQVGSNSNPMDASFIGLVPVIAILMGALGFMFVRTRFR